MKTPQILKILFCFFILSTRASAQPISKITIDGAKLILFCGSDQLILQACADNILKVNYLSGGREDADTLVIAVSEWPAVSVSFDTSSDPIRMTAPQFVAEISRSPMRMQFYSAADAWLCGEPGNSGMNAGSLILTCPTAQFYGVSNRQTGSLQNTQGGVISAGAQGGAGAPFVWTTNGWGLLVDSDGGRMDIRANSLVFSRPASPSKRDLECYLLFGSAKEIITAMTTVCGRPPLFPKFTLGFLNTEWGMDEAELRSDVATYRQKNIPLDAYVLDFDWMDWGADNYGEFRWGGKFPNGAGGILKADLDRLGLKLLGIRKPRIHLGTEQGTLAQLQGFFHSYTTDYFSGKQVGRLNFHLPAVRDWYWNAFIQRGDAYAGGIIGYWNDEADEYGGNLMFLQMQRAQFEGQRRYNTRRVWSINRNFYLGAQRYAYGLWSGDIATGFTSMDRQRLFMLSSIVLGSSWWGMDIGGFNGTPDAENYFRWIQFGAFVPIFRVHGNNGEEREPWNYGAEAESIATKYIRLRYQLMPYIYSAARQNHLTGLSITRPLVMEYPDDPNCADNTSEWLFGESLLVHPITQAGVKKASVYLPPGQWIDYRHGGRHQGPGSITVKVAREDIPLFVKAGAVIPEAPVGAFIDDVAAADPLILTCYPGADGTFELYEDDGVTYGYENGEYCTTIFTQRYESETTTLEISPRRGGFTPPERDYLATFTYLPQPPDSVLLDGTALPYSAAMDKLTARKWSFDVSCNRCYVRLFDDGAGHSIRLKFSPDWTAPEVDTVSCTTDTTVLVRFTEPVQPGIGEGGGENTANYTISPDIAIYQATLSADQKSVLLTTSPHRPEQMYSMSIANITDQSPNKNVLPSTTASYSYTAPITYRRILQQGLNGYAGCRDTHIAENFLDRNMGGYAYFEACRYAGDLETDDKHALVRFDLAGLDLADSLLSAHIELTLADTRNGASAKTLGCYRLLRAWGEGDKNAGIDGAPAAAGEVTWNSAKHQQTLWRQPGGDIDHTPVSLQFIGSAVGVVYSWEVTSLFRAWLSHPDSNFGVLFKEPQTGVHHGTKVFYAREHPQIDVRPRLTLTLTKKTTPVRECLESVAQMPSEPILHPNHPNPFNEATFLAFYLPRESRVQLAIYAVNGQLVEQILDERRPAGRHQLRWRAGKRPSGVYLVVLNVAGSLRRQKCLILR